MHSTSKDPTLLVPHPQVWSDSFQGAYWKILSCASFAGINVVVRYLSTGLQHEGLIALNTQVMVFFQNAIAMIFILPFFMLRGQRLSLHTRYPTVHFLRIVSAVLGVSLWYLALKYISIAEGVALSFMTPIFAVLGAWLFLQERLTKQSIIAIILSVVGAYIIARPDITLLKTEHSLGIMALLPLGSAMAFAWNKLLTRQLGRLSEKPYLSTAYLLIGMAPISLIPALFDWVTPLYYHWPWLILLGILGLVANIAFGKAYALAQVTFLTPFGFSKFLFSMIFGYYFFKELPSMSVWVGLLVIGISIFLLVYKIPLYSIARRFKSS